MTTVAIERTKKLLREKQEKEDAMETAKTNLRLLFETIPNKRNMVLRGASAGRVILLVKRSDAMVGLIDIGCGEEKKLPQPLFNDIETVLKSLGERITEIETFLNQDPSVLALSIQDIDFGHDENLLALLK